MNLNVPLKFREEISKPKTWTPEELLERRRKWYGVCERCDKPNVAAAWLGGKYKLKLEREEHTTVKKVALKSLEGSNDLSEKYLEQ
ncbi:5206_t:CDS:2, partial [Funneliformis caledonium]